MCVDFTLGAMFGIFYRGFVPGSRYTVEQKYVIMLFVVFFQRNCW